MCLDGPEIANVMGPKLAKAGDYVTFTCNAISNPPSIYEWYFENVLVSNKSEYVTPSLTTSMSGKYLCVAFNSISGKNSTADIMLTVIGKTYVTIFFGVHKITFHS